MPRATTTRVERKAFTVGEFCDAYRISKAQYYEMKKDGKAPAEAHVRGRVIISLAAAEKWLEERQAEGKTNSRKHLRRKKK